MHRYGRSPIISLLFLVLCAQAELSCAHTAESSQPRIKGIYLHLVYRYGFGGFAAATYQPYVLLPDGSITDDLAYYPASDADLPRWRAHKPSAWGNWSQTGSKITIHWHDPERKPETWDKWFIARPGKPGQKLSGLFQSVGGGGNIAFGGNVAIAAWSDFRFSPDGTVTSGGGTGGYSGGSGASVATSSERAPQQARYEINNYSIRLTYPDGRSETRWFFLYPDSDYVIGVGAGTYDNMKSGSSSR